MRVILAFALATIASVSQATLNHCCDALDRAGLSERLIYPGYEAYEAGVNKYFSTSARLSPHCFLRPQNAVEVSRAVTALVEANKTQACRFAVRSGGHTHFAGASGIEDGVTIDLGDMKSIVHHVGNSTVSVGSGAVWGDVYEHLDKIGVMVGGGRSYSVGVGGLILGGGNSYYAARKGMVCDNVAQFEVVLADGSIITASPSENVDLFQALKGGSSNFGIVTRFELAAFEGGNVFGGLVLYPESTSEEQFQSLVSFGDKIEDDPYGSAIVLGIYMSALKTPMFMDAFEYTSPVERPAVFADFFSIRGNMSDTTGIRNMTSLARELEFPKTHRVQFSTLTFKNDIRVLRRAHELFKTVIATLEEKAADNWELYVLYQPIPPVFARHSQEKGGNVLGLDRFDETLIMYEPYFAWQDPSLDALFEAEAEWLRSGLATYAASIGADNEFVYLDYADISQKPLESYGAANVAKIRAAAKKYDPQGVFQTMMPGGFKISKASRACWAFVRHTLTVRLG